MLINNDATIIIMRRWGVERSFPPNKQINQPHARAPSSSFFLSLQVLKVATKRTAADVLRMVRVHGFDLTAVVNSLFQEL